MNQYLFAVFVIGALPGCGDDAESATQLDDSKHLSALSDAELGALCDWSNAQQGGYGKQTTCPNGLTVSTQKDLSGRHCFMNSDTYWGSVTPVQFPGSEPRPSSTSRALH